MRDTPFSGENQVVRDRGIPAVTACTGSRRSNLERAAFVKVGSGGL
jgi:hypothetical protein